MSTISRWLRSLGANLRLKHADLGLGGRLLCALGANPYLNHADLRLEYADASDHHERSM